METTHDEEMIAERRTAGPPEVRELDGVTELFGYAAVFNEWSRNLGGFVERVLPGFFADVLDRDIRALWQHKPEYVLGRTVNGTMKLWEDDIGLAYRIIPPDTQWARDVVVTIKRGDVNQTSFGFAVQQQVLEPPQKDGLARRTLVKAKDLYDVSPVTFAAYPQTSAQVRSEVAELRAQQPLDDTPADDQRGRDVNLMAWYDLKKLEVSNE